MNDPTPNALPLPPTERESSPLARIIQIGGFSGFEWTRYTLPVSDLPADLDGFRIVHLTDLHLRGRWHQVYDALHERLRLNPPDMLLITGDLVHRHYAKPAVLRVLERFLAGLSARLGSWMILGNHDGELLGPQLVRIGANLIDGRVVRLNKPAPIELIGLPGVSRADLNDGFLRSIPPRNDPSLRIVLSHYPDAIRQLDPLRADLVLAGHTHGGQICLPNGFAPLTHDSLPQRFVKGVFRWNDAWFVISRGFGFGSPQIRVFCPNEVIELTLNKVN